MTDSEHHHATEHKALSVARAAYLALLLWQIVWLIVLPEPAGKQNLWLGVLLSAPLLLPLAGVFQLRVRPMILAGYLGFFAAIFSMMEWWASPAERWSAGLHLLLSVLFLLSLARGTPRRRKKQ